MTSRAQPVSDRSAYVLGVMFASAGAAHFAKPDFFEAVVPRWFPNPALTNQVSGAAEIALGVAMVPRRTRRVAAFGLLALLAVVFPANVDMYVKNVKIASGEDGRLERIEGVEATRRANLIRLPFQFVFGALVWRHTRKIPSITPSPSEEHN
ncbi:MAG: hypothetical protein RIB98_00060 [Acidimicrobiales bacterium]